MAQVEQGKRWGGEAYYGLDHEFDPRWFLSDELRELEARLIRRCQEEIRPNAIEADRTGAYPQRNLEILAEEGLLAAVVLVVLAWRVSARFALSERYGAR